MEMKLTGTNSLAIVRHLTMTFLLPHPNPEIRKGSKKLLSQIDHSQQQVYGTVTIEIPEDPPGTTEENYLTNVELVNRYETAMDKWTNTIKETINKEKNREESRTAIAEIELWRTRAASYSTLYQQLSLPSISTIVQRLEKYYSDPSNSLTEFNREYKELSKLNSEAKDNVKFLTTLERQFKDLASDEGLFIVEETIPSLMNGLRMVWTISRHYKEGDKMNILISLITN
jgi:dynein heavy chain